MKSGGGGRVDKVETEREREREERGKRRKEMEEEEGKMINLGESVCETSPL